MARTIQDYLAGLNTAQQQQQPNMSYMPQSQMMQAQAAQLPDPQDSSAMPPMPQIPGATHAYSGVNPQILGMLRPPAYIKPPDMTEEKGLIKQYSQHSEDQLNKEGAGIDQLQGMLNDYQKAPRGMDWTPLASYIDSIVPGSKLTEAAKAIRPESPQEKQARIMNLQTMIQERTGAMSQRDLGALGEQISNMKANAQLEQTRQFQNAQLGQQYNQTLATLGKMSMAQNNLNFREIKSAQGGWDRDKILNTYVPRIDGATKILGLMDAAEGGDFKSNQAMLGQLNAEISRLETGSQAPGLGASEKTEMESALAKLSAVKDKLTNKVSGVDLHEQFDQARGMVRDLGKSYYDQIDKRAGTIKAGATPAQAPVFQAKHDQVMGAYKDTFGAGARQQLHPMDSQAVQWAKANPDDPRAQKILQVNGVK